MDKKIDDLKIIKKVFDKYNVRFFIVYGTCLGFYRDNNFLPGDEDIDLAIVDKIDFKTRKAIGWALYDLGFEPQAISFNVFGRMEMGEQGYNGNEETGIIVCQKNTKFTIFFFKEEVCEKHGKEYVCIPKLGAMKLIATPTRFYEKAGTIKIGNERFNVPYPTDEYLEFSYRDWKDKTARDHSPTYLEAHSDEMIKDLDKKNAATIFRST